MGFDYKINQIKYNEGSSIPHADAMCRLNFDQNNDECNLVDYLGPNFDEFYVHFVEHRLIQFEELRSESERNEVAQQSSRRVIDDDWKACP